MDINRLLSKPADQFAIDTATNAATEAALAAPTAPKLYIIKGISISADRAPTGPIVVEVLTGSTVLKRYEIPAAAFSPIEINYGGQGGLLCAKGEAASITCEAGGVDVVVTVGIAAIVVTE